MTINIQNCTFKKNVNSKKKLLNHEIIHEKHASFYTSV